MFGRRFVGMALVVLGAFALFGMIRTSSYRQGLSEGYYMAQQQADNSGTDSSGTEAEATAASPDQPNHYGPGYRYGRGPGFGWAFGHGWGGSPFLWIIGALFKFWIFLMVIGLIGRFFFGGRHGQGQADIGVAAPGAITIMAHEKSPPEDLSDEPVMKA